MPKPVFRPLHLPRQPKVRPPMRRMALVAGALPPPCRRAQGCLAQSDGLPWMRPWRRQAVREGVLVTLVTTLLTSSVLAAPEVFRQSPLTTLGQLTTSGLAVGQSSSGPLWLDCP